MDSFCHHNLPELATQVFNQRNYEDFLEYFKGGGRFLHKLVTDDLVIVY